MPNRRLEAELNDLRTRFKISLDQLTADEIAGLVDCCRRIDRPYADALAMLSDAPSATVRGVPFYRLTVGAAMWLDEYASKWWAADDAVYFWAIAFAMVHARERDAFACLTDRDRARRAVLKTCLRFVFSRSEVEAAVVKALAGETPDAPGKDGEKAAQNDWATFVARLETQTGIRKDEWLWGRSAAYTVRAYKDLHAFAETYSAGNECRRTFDEMDAAINALARMKKSVKDRLEKEAAENGKARS